MSRNQEAVAPRAILVLGPESSGTRLTTRLLMSAGFAGSDAHDQPFDHSPPRPEVHPRVVWRRSVPHGGEWPRIAEMGEGLRCAGYEVQALVIVRDWVPLARSQVANGHVATVEQAEANLRGAYPHIFGEVARAGIPFVVVTLEGLHLGGRGAIEGVFERLGIPREIAGRVEPVRNENAKRLAS